MKYLIGVDIGTQGTKAAMYGLRGNMVAEALEASNLITPSPGTVMQEPEEIFGSVLHTIRAVMDQSGAAPVDVAALAFDGQMAGVMGIDQHFGAATYYDSWLDTRCEPYIEMMKNTARKRVVALTGCPITYAHGPKILWWKHEHPDTYRKIRKFVMVHGYAAGRLCGLSADDAFIDYTNIHFTGYADNERKQWSAELLDIFDIDPDKMPAIIEPWKKVGGISKAYAQQCGLLAGTPVMAGCGDSAATSLGAGIVRVGQVFDVAGTASIFSCCVDRYVPDTAHEAMLQMRSVIDGYWQPLAYINGGGLCLRWFRDHIAQSDYDTLERLASEAAPGAEGLLFSPHFSGRVCPNNPNVKGSFIGLDWVHNHAHMYRAIMEGIAYEYRYYLEVLRDIGVGQAFHTVSVMGGGARSSLFNRIKADVLGLAYQALTNTDTATLGCAVIAGFGAGVYGDIAQTVESFVTIGDRVEPDHSHEAVYERMYRCYAEQFDALGGLYKKLKAAGEKA